MARVILNAFTPRPSLFEGQKDFDKEYVEIKVRKVVEKTGEGEEDYILKDKVVVVSRTPINEYINSFADDVGMPGLVKSLGGLDPDPASVPHLVDGVNDFTNAPQDIHEAQAAIEKGVNLFDSLPEDLRCKKSFADFINGMTAEDMTNYLKEAYDKKMKNLEGDKDKDVK